MALHWRISIGLLSGVVFGITAVLLGMQEFTTDWIAPIGTVFINLLKLIAAPLIFSSLVTGLTSLGELAKLPEMAGKAAILFVLTTIAAICIGLAVVNALRPGALMSSDASSELQASYERRVLEHSEVVTETRQQTPLATVVELVPDNLFAAFSDNRRMLQVVFFAVLFGCALLLIRPQTNGLLEGVVKEVNDVILRIVGFAMFVAPVGVFALIAGTIATFASGKLTNVIELLTALGFYCLVVLIGLVAQLVFVYGGLIKAFTPMRFGAFLRAIAPAQLVALSTSSSAATLPVSMECVGKGLKVSPDVAAFVLPIGATVNVDGTALYQAVAAVFIAQVFGIPLDFQAQLTIVLVALLASIGSAPVPGGGLVMLVIVLESVGVPSAGLALIVGVDRLLDMGRTVINVTGDCTVAMVIDALQMRGKHETGE